MAHSYTRRMELELNNDSLRDLLGELGRKAGDGSTIQLTLIGGAAGILTGELPPTRTTTDCDVIRAEPTESWSALLHLAAQLARERGLPTDWFNDRITQLDVLPSSWRKRRVSVGTFGRIKVWSVGRRDLIATKVFAGRMQDRADVQDMNPTAEERAFARRYLDQLRVPGRLADLDQIQSALRFLDALEGPAK